MVSTVFLLFSMPRKTSEIICLTFLLALDHAGKCWVESEKKAYAPGESWSPAGECSKYTCQEGGGFSAIG